jgi:ubiquinone/menaquinone biosynthesis C-methylase UbiE
MQNINNLPPDGERLTEEYSGQIVHEHLHRYAIAKQYVEDKDVLDIACGVGYGSNFLSQVAKTVVGVDISEHAILYAQAKYSKANLSFRVGSCTKIPFPPNSFDVIVSFETIEHFTDHETFMYEIKRVLKPDGMLIMSSPDKRIYSDRPKYSNPFHVRELYHEDFKLLINRYFKKSFFGKQIYNPGSFIEIEFPAKVMHIAGNFDHATYNYLMEEAVYSISFSSDNELPKIESSLFHAQINTTCPALAMMQLFIKSDKHFCEAKCINIYTALNRRQILEFTNLERYLDSQMIYLRLDPGDSVHRIDLHSVELKTENITGEINTKMLGAPSELNNLIEIDAESKLYLSTNNDPQFYFNPMEVELNSKISLCVEITISSDLQFVAEKLSYLEALVTNENFSTNKRV